MSTQYPSRRRNRRFDDELDDPRQSRRSRALADDTSQDDPPAGDRWSTWDLSAAGERGPQPYPDWLVTELAAVDTELGVLKTGKEADVHLVRRESTDGSGAEVVMAAKRYRDDRHRTFHRADVYTVTRRARRSRDARAVKRGSEYGRAVAAGMWVQAEWAALCRYWQAGVPVPYPVQVDGAEILMELVGAHGEAAPRLAQARPARALLESYFEQVRSAMIALAREGVAHGDLSPYNVLADGDRIVLIDLPQVVDVVANPRGPEFLLRDCENMCAWFTARGLDVDAQELFGELVGFVY